MKKFLLFVTCMIIFGVVVLGAGAFYVYDASNASGPLAETKIILIERGQGIAGIAEKLESEGVVFSALVFKIAAGVQKSKGSLKAGEYEFTPAISVNSIIEQLRLGKVYDRKITFPEGLTSHQIVKLLNDNDTLTGTIDEIPAEGTLLPETYHFIKGDSRAGIIGQMSTAMTKTIDELWPTRVNDLPVKTIEEAVTLASIVEKETGVASERAKVAGVFINRLRQGMPLQSDPTIIYAMTQGAVEEEGQGPIGRRLLTKDLDTVSPYNTYLNPGLPPTPIANPGRDSIEAVLHPEIHDYIYFVADGTGGHVFARTLTEHNTNVAKWRKIRRSQQQ